MPDITDSCVAKSNEINAVDLTAAPITVTIIGVSYTKGAERPVVIDVGIEGKSWIPGLTCRRILRDHMSPRTEEWIGHQVSLYCDPDVVHKNERVGGIRISGLSSIDKVVEHKALQSQRKRVTYIIHPITRTTATLAPPLPAYTDEDMDKNAAAWEAAIKAGKSTTDSLIRTIEKRFTLTDNQKEAIRLLGAQDE